MVVKTVYADAVPGQPGYVYSPHTSPRKMVDVRGYRGGDEVRCPYTAQPFIVPDFKAVAAASKPSPERPVHAAEEVVSNSQATTLLDESLARLEPVVEPPVAPPNPAEPVRIDSTPAARPEIPYGTRVAGRPGFVNSPYAAKSQLVDVSRYAPGVLVKCPYTNKMFRVPEMNVEEVKPSPSPVPPPAEPAETPPAVSPDNTVPPPFDPAQPLSPGSSPDNPR